MTTATHWRGVSLDELIYRIEFCLDNYHFSTGVHDRRAA
jgi:hypothetical protein